MSACPILSALTALSDLPYPLYLACSGGRDSLVLAYGCYLLYQRGKLEKLPTLLHVHHGMQQANDDWAKLVGAWADKHGFNWQILPLTLIKKNETTARTARYQALAGAMADDGVLLVAHHADDQAETVLMRLINGAGVQGLSGMRVWQTKTIQGRKLSIHRPLLGISRHQISAFAHAHALAYVDDPTNETTDNARNLIRNDILPRLSALNPKVRQNIARTAHLMNDAHLLMNKTVFDLFKKCTSTSTNNHTPFVDCLDIQALRTLLAFEQSAVVRFFVQGDKPLAPSYQTMSDTMALTARTDGDHSTKIFWQGGIDENMDNTAIVLCRYKDTLYRHHHDLFLLLQDKMSDDKIPLTSSKMILKKNATFAIFLECHDGFYELLMDKMAYIKPITRDEWVWVCEGYVDKDGQTQIGSTKLGGKKLYQKLSIPTWQRPNLWGIYAYDEPVLMMSMEKYWLTDSTMFGDLFALFDGKYMGRTLLAVDKLI